MRICFIGDELVAGVGDPRGLGWVGRVNAHSTFDLPATFLTLAVPSETTKQMAARWEAEVLPRLAEGEPHGLVIGVGPGDVAAGISTARSRLNLANITDRATALGIPSFVVGPPPLAAGTARRYPARPATPSWRGSSSTRAGTSGRERSRRTCEHRRNVCTHVIHVSPPRAVR